MPSDTPTRRSLSFKVQTAFVMLLTDCSTLSPVTCRWYLGLRMRPFSRLSRERTSLSRNVADFKVAIHGCTAVAPSLSRILLTMQVDIWQGNIDVISATDE